MAKTTDFSAQQLLRLEDPEYALEYVAAAVQSGNPREVCSAVAKVLLACEAKLARRAE